MTIGPRETLVALVSAAIAGAGAAATLVGNHRFAFLAVTALLLIIILLQLVALRRVALRQKGLDRIERKLDAMGRRIVTESEALSREIRRQDM